MGIPNNDPLFRQIQSVAFTDGEIARLLKVAAADAALIVSGSGSNVRKAQVALARLSGEMWSGVESAIGVGIGDAIYNATEYQALFDEDLFGRAGMSSTYWRHSMIATAAQGIQSVISRKQNGISLSDRVVFSNQKTKQALNDTINSGLLLGKSPKEIAKDVSKYIRPDVPGGVSYAAMRIGRSEVLNAYHTTALNKYKETPWIKTARWNLSGSHPKPDECNEYADDVHYKGGEAGVWLVEEVPGKPHPNCLCYVTPVSLSLDEFAKAFKAGKYDGYIEKGMGCHAGA